jgi:aldose 1-epimerase
MAGERYTIKKTWEIHGLVFTEPWKFTKPVVTSTGVSFKTSIIINKTSSLFEGFPFPCVLTLEYKLYSKGIKVTYTVKNTGLSELPFGFALHPYFNRLSGTDKTTISVPAKSWMESPNDTLLPTGKLVNVTGKPYDLRRPQPLSHLNLDHVFTDLAHYQFATINYKTHHIKVILKTSPEFTHVVVYTGHQKAVCIENQTCSTDAHNLYARGLIKESHLLIIKPKLSHSGFINYEISSY